MFPSFPGPYNPFRTYSNAELVRMIHDLQQRVLQLETSLACSSDQVKIKAGTSVLTMKKDGTVTLEGKNVTVKASGDLDLKGSSIRRN